jgi:hypothetical protein
MKILRILAVTGLVTLAGTACADLEVVNLNDPDRERALATPGDVESLITGAFRSYWYANQDWAPGPALSTGADEASASWGNFFMKDFSSEPRVAIPNSPSYGYAYVIEDPWFSAYSGLAAVRDGIIAIEGGLVIEDEDGADVTNRALTFGKMIQGLSMGWIALLYDQGFTLDETTDIETAVMVPYNEVMAVGLAKLDEAISLAGSTSFTTNDAWMSGTFTNTDLAKFMHSMKARFMAQVPRTEADRGAVNWGAVISEINQGITEDFTIYGDDIIWWDILKTYNEFSTWARGDIRTLGPADQSGGYQAWMAMPVEQRNEFLIDTDDARITGGDPESDGLYFRYSGPSGFRPNRGTYHFSYYSSSRYIPYWSDWLGDMEFVTVAEMDHLKAEALYRTNGSMDEILQLVNKYRVPNSGLPAVTANGVVGQDRCVPKMPNGACADLWETMKYEKRIEVWHTAAGIAFFDDRGWGDLVQHTAVQFPVPAQELLTLLMDVYTFGGPGGDGAAPDQIINPEFTPELIKERVRTFERINNRHAKRFSEMTQMK